LQRAGIILCRYVCNLLTFLRANVGDIWSTGRMIPMEENWSTGGKLLLSTLSRYESRIIWPGIESGSPQREAGD
jgi:hypothetical protein